jgi:cysteinyl-tRNA synthetase
MTPKAWKDIMPRFAAPPETGKTMLRLYNTMTRNADPFQTIEPGKVRLYTCGPTVYNYAHIGNLRTYVFEDTLKRALRWLGWDVLHVMNVTDVGHLVSDGDEGEDKMALGAQREGKTVWQIAEDYWQAFREDLQRLEILEPDVWCKATEHIQEQIDVVRTLENKDYTYKTSDGIYFDTSRLEDYGKLARLDVTGLQAGARVEMSAEKRNPTDFALWKFSPTDKQRAMEWDSPKYLGERIDIHCGGVDHVAVHHTNEIAQAEACLGHEWVNWWMHGEFLTMPKGDNGQEAKMSKSSGEFLTLNLLVEKGYDPLAYRYFLLGAHYRQQLQFSWKALDAATRAYQKLRRALLDLRNEAGDAQGKSLGEGLHPFRQAVEDDLNMPRALACVWTTLKLDAAPQDLHATLLEMDKVLGLGMQDMAEEQLDVSDEQIDTLLAQRTQARKDKDFARADAIRDELAQMGIEIKDSPEGTTWKRK